MKKKYYADHHGNLYLEIKPGRGQLGGAADVFAPHTVWVAKVGSVAEKVYKLFGSAGILRIPPELWEESIKAAELLQTYFKGLKISRKQEFDPSRFSELQKSQRQKCGLFELSELGEVFVPDL